MRRVCAVIATLFCLVLSAPVSGQSAARALELNEKNYNTIRQAIVCSDDESSWREISWRPNLGEAVVEAREQGKPILLWAMNGHPCGMT